MLIRDRARRLLSARPSWRTLAPYGIGTAVVITILAAYARLALVPIHGVHDEAACTRAYAKARTFRDSLSVDFLSYPDPSGRAISHRCGYVRSTAVGVLPR